MFSEHSQVHQNEWFNPSCSHHIYVDSTAFPASEKSSEPSFPTTTAKHPGHTKAVQALEHGMQCLADSSRNRGQI